MTTEQIQTVVQHYPQITGIHPTCQVMPQSDERQLTILRNPIQQRGLLEPIALTPDGQLIDGWARVSGDNYRDR